MIERVVIVHKDGVGSGGLGIGFGDRSVPASAVPDRLRARL
jgi:hypothetical protein